MKALSSSRPPRIARPPDGAMDSCIRRIAPTQDYMYISAATPRPIGTNAPDRPRRISAPAVAIGVAHGIVLEVPVAATVLLVYVRVVPLTTTR